MTLDEAILALDQLRNLLASGRRGSDIEVYFDCPACGKVFTPAILVTEDHKPKLRIHIAAVRAALYQDQS